MAFGVRSALVLTAFLAGCSDQPATPTAEQGEVVAAQEELSIDPDATGFGKAIVFQGVGSCFPAPVFNAELKALLSRFDEGADIEPRRPTAHSSYLGKAVAVTEGYLLSVTAPVEGKWLGLRLASIQHWAAPETDYIGFSLGFSATKAEVIKAVNGIGFGVLATGDLMIEGEVESYIRVLEDTNGKAFLQCGS
ncbi:hypothetical protein [Blastomonas sp.]|uniref:hypothetical protein n=1 Tax=Blastomonas sp. TaxID=1909299 RepID=UPI00359363AE